VAPVLPADSDQELEAQDIMIVPPLKPSKSGARVEVL
jgi:hypothetical protein